jgi:hypothetical protein
VRQQRAVPSLASALQPTGRGENWHKARVAR